MHKITRYLNSLLLLLSFFALSNTQAADDQELLSPEQAFRISANGEAADKIQVKWRIADGYYLYQSKIKFDTDASEITLMAPDFPKGEEINDEFFGEIEIYRGEVIVDIPVIKDEKIPDIITLEARSQGCADIGVCYPPQTQTLLVAMSDVADSPAPVDPSSIEEIASIGSESGSSNNTPENNPLDALESFGDSFGLEDEEDGILSPEEAYILSHDITTDGKLALNWKIAEGTYLYNDKIKLTLKGDPGLDIASYDLPEPKVKKDGVRPDGSIGDIKIYKDKLFIDVPFTHTASKAGNAELTISYQGCAERGICYPPVNSVIPLSFPAKGDGNVSLGNADDAKAAADNAAPSPAPVSAAADSADNIALASEEDKIASMIRDNSTFAVVGIFFLIGLGLAFTPCVFPMIPILSGIISGQGENITTGKATYLSVVYVLAMAVTYTAAGVFAAMSGENLQILLQIPWVIAIFAAIFVLLALSMFGFYELQLPSSVQSKLTEISNKQSGGSTIGVAIMGLLSALIVGPCVAPPLAGALLYIGQTNDPVLGGLALFAMSMGMGVPLILIGASAGKLLPRAGGWMDAVKAVFGVSMLGLAIYFLERILPETIILLLWGSLLIVSAIYMGALQQLPVEASGWKKLWKGLGVILLVYGAMMLIGAAADGKDVRQPLRGLSIGGGTADHANANVRHFKRLTTMAELDNELSQAKAAGKPVILDFYADWCVYCKTLEKEIFPAPNAQTAMGDAVLLQADVTDAGSDEAKAIMKRFGVIAPPVIVFWDKNGNELRQHKIVGDVTLEDFVAKTKTALK
ncbi:MAG: protein-disulfide reductase DsbD [Gammaproteobacteria bacterium]|nr:protein-disulfide reductase DsbD [Gammaproteobacteria bacterium]